VEREVARVLEGMMEEEEEADRRQTIAEAGAVPALVGLLSSGKGEEAERAAGALWNLAVGENNRQRIGEVGGIEPLVRLLWRLGWDRRSAHGESRSLNE
jgi:hypothetical protein